MKQAQRPRALLALFVMVLSFLPLGAARAATPVFAPATGMFNPHKGLRVSLSPGAESTATGVEATADLKIVTDDAVEGFELDLLAHGTIALISPASQSLPGAARNSKLQKGIAYTVTGDGEGRLEAVVRARVAGSARVERRSFELYVNAAAGDALHGTRGPLDLKVKRLQKRRASGELDAEQYQREFDRTFYAGAASTTTLQPQAAGDVSAQASTDITVSGQALWTDSAGGTHPVRLAPVEFWEHDILGSSGLVATVQTDAQGNYSHTMDNWDGVLQNGRDLTVRVLAKGPAFTVDSPGLIGSSTYGIESAQVNDIPDGAGVTINLTANNVDVNNIAFSIQSAAVTVNEYVAMRRGSSLPEIDFEFPNGEDAAYYTTSFPDTHISLRIHDAFDWDVIHHEYGHYVMDELDIESNPGGQHFINGNHAEIHGKDAGLRLAWGEGWPTYFGTALQQQMNTAAFNIPRVGDLSYTDLDAAGAVYIEYSLEDKATMVANGEDSELALQRILWDLYDVADDSGDSGVAYGDSVLWSLIDNANAVNFAQAYQAISAGKQVKEVAQIGCVLAEHGVAPLLTAPANNSVAAATTPPTFSWNAQGGGPTFLNDKFIVEFYDHSFTRLLLATPEQDATSFTPTQAQWETLLRDAGPLLNWVVKGRQSANPATGPYTSCASRVAPAKIDLVFVIDTTGSMWDDIASVKSSAASIVDALSASGSDFRIAVVDFKDFPISPYGDPGDYPARTTLGFSNNKTSIISAINSLSAGGGNDWPESVYTGLMTAINLSWRADASKSIILMGDAPPHDPEPVSGYTLFDVVLAAIGAGVTPSLAPLSSTGTSSPSAPSAAASGGGVKIYSILVGYDYSARVAFQALSDQTGGELFAAGNASQVVAAIMAAIGSILSSPTADAGGPYLGQVGQPISFSASGSSDPDGSIVKYEWDFESDGVFDLVSAAPGASHTYPAAFAGEVTLRVTDDDGRTATDRASVEVLVVGGGQLTLGAISAPLDPIVVNTTNEASATFSDPGAPGSHTAVWSWGDGSTSAGTVNESGATGSVHGSHAYATPGVYEVSLQVTNRLGTSASASFQYVIVYDPSGGFVTGGGWISSPAGAYRADPALSGRASFGFVAKYQRGANGPIGNTEFQFKAGGMSFTSSSYEWLVVSGARAQYKGSGTINGAGSYKFMLTALDGAIAGGASVDALRVKIWDAADGTLVYDNQLGAGDSEAPTTAVGGGSIVIHARGGQ